MLMTLPLHHLTQHFVALHIYPQAGVHHEESRTPPSLPGSLCTTATRWALPHATSIRSWHPWGEISLRARRRGDFGVVNSWDGRAVLGPFIGPEQREAADRGGGGIITGEWWAAINGVGRYRERRRQVRLPSFGTGEEVALDFMTRGRVNDSVAQWPMAVRLGGGGGLSHCRRKMMELGQVTGSKSRLDWVVSGPNQGIWARKKIEEKQVGFQRGLGQNW
jgi:hypothetical protein